MQRDKLLKRLSRRNFIRNSVVATTGLAVLPSVLSSCSDDDSEEFMAEGEFGFFEGVARFDPTQSEVILWTRYTPATNEVGSPTILLDVALASNFDQVVASEMVVMDANSDNTINVDVSGLSSNTKYYYRFRNEVTGATSIVGETRTMPAAGEASEVKMAVVSCANFQAGLFNVYGAVANSDADVVVHLGDYIYEYDVGGFGTNDMTSALGREHDPEGEIISTEDYRARYRQYRSDEQLQRAHQLKPFICVWDDHEITNDAFTDGAENHQMDEGDFETRKMSAIQVWHEYLPARVDDNSKIFRNFEIAGFVNLVMLDTRIIGREEQLNLANYFTSEGLDINAFAADWQNPNRTLLGSEQKAWVSSQLSTSNAKWQVLGSQVLMGKYMIPTELLVLTASIASSGSASPALLAQYNNTVTELVTIKGRILAGDPTVTAEERARVENVLPYNLDAWDGYPAEREAIYNSANGKNLITLAGDTHNSWYSALTNGSGNKVGAEFATSSVSSPGFEAIFGTDPTVIGGFEQSNNLLIDDLIYSDASRRGYLMVSFTEGSANADWRYIGTLNTLDNSTISGNTATEN